MKTHHFRALAVVGTMVLFVPGAQAAHELEGRDTVAGAKLYRENCASCHGADLQGQANWRSPNKDGVLPAPPHNESGHTWHHDNKLLFDYTKLGGQALLSSRGVELKSGMPGFAESLSDDDIWNILAFIQSTWPERVQEMQSSRNPPHD